MSLLQLNSAIPLAEPLLEQRKQRHDTSENENRAKADFRTQSKFIFLGTLTGFFIQLVSLGAYACLLLRYEGKSPTGFDSAILSENRMTQMDELFQLPNTETDIIDDTKAYFGKDTIVYTILSVLTQIDLVVYVLIWVAFTCTMTRNGMACIRSQFFSKIKSNKHSAVVRRRYIFVLGVCFLVGIVLGAFGAWSAVDVFLGYPIPFAPILVTAIVDLVLCYMMVCCFDMGGDACNILAEDDEEVKIEFEHRGKNEASDEEDSVSV